MSNPWLAPDQVPIRRQVAHRIGVRWANGRAKLFQVQFRQDGFFVHFPYQPDSQGVVARCILPVIPPGATANINLADTGYVTSHKVKYSHHVDGNCHFSQDGRVVTAVRNAASRLDQGSVGHVFTVYVQGITNFSTDRTADVEWFATSTSVPPTGLRIVGRWHKADIPYNVQNPISIAGLPPGLAAPVLASCPPNASPLSDYVLVLQAFIQPLNAEPPFVLIFSGGFGPEAADQSKESDFLGLLYPATQVGQLSSIDWKLPNA